ncbi:MAG: radical SAM protein [Thermofilaceae archaeon]
MSVEYRRVRVSSALSKSSLYDLDYAYNPYAGCEHGCLYCYARCFTRYRDAAEQWGRVVYVKENAVEALAKDVRRADPGIVGVSTITDPYQPVEARELLSRRGIEVLLSAGFRVSVQTKSPLVLRDLDILSRHRQLVDVGLTITTMRAEVAKLIEPRAPPPVERARALSVLGESGVETWVFLGPIIRGVNDGEEAIREVARVAQETGSRLYYDYFRMKPGLEKSMQPILRRHPQALDTSPAWRESVSRLVERICGELGVECIPSKPQHEQRRITLLHFLNDRTLR